MKTILRSLLAIVWIAGPFARAAITVPGADGSDGVLNITEDTVIDLSQAVAGTWDQDNSANAGKGVYDAAKWAVVFKYSSVNVAAGATVTFTNHPSKAPVVWLVSGDVTIEGMVKLDGQAGQTTPALAEPGPGGFRGASGKYSTDVDAGAGFGPGGGFRDAKGGAYGSGTAPYGNPSLVPLIGGSGGSAVTGKPQGAGAGGGALLIASSGTVTINGTISANGGDGPSYGYQVFTGGGSGGGLRVVCSTLAGTGILNALAGRGGRYAAAGLGRIRIERVDNNNTLQVNPDPSVVPLTDGDTALVWPPADAPTVKIVSIGGVAAPDDPRASFGTHGADVALPETTTIQVVIETTGVEQAAQVQVRLTPRSNGDAVVVDATMDSVVAPGPPEILRWIADVPVGNGYSAVQAKVVRP
jgi:plastocyanin